MLYVWFLVMQLMVQGQGQRDFSSYCTSIVVVTPRRGDIMRLIVTLAEPLVGVA